MPGVSQSGIGPTGRSTVAIAGTVAASVARSMTGGAGFAAEVLTVFGDTVPVGDLAFAIGTGAFGGVLIFHSANT